MISRGRIHKWFFRLIEIMTFSEGDDYFPSGAGTVEDDFITRHFTDTVEPGIGKKGLVEFKSKLLHVTNQNMVQLKEEDGCWYVQESTIQFGTDEVIKKYLHEAMPFLREQYFDFFRDFFFFWRPASLFFEVLGIGRGIWRDIYEETEAQMYKDVIEQFLLDFFSVIGLQAFVLHLHIVPFFLKDKVVLKRWIYIVRNVFINYWPLHVGRSCSSGHSLENLICFVKEFKEVFYKSTKIDLSVERKNIFMCLVERLVFDIKALANFNYVAKTWCVEYPDRYCYLYAVGQYVRWINPFNFRTGEVLNEFTNLMLTRWSVRYYRKEIMELNEIVKDLAFGVPDGIVDVLLYASDVFSLKKNSKDLDLVIISLYESVLINATPTDRDLGKELRPVSGFVEARVSKNHSILNFLFTGKKNNKPFSSVENKQYDAEACDRLALPGVGAGFEKVLREILKHLPKNDEDLTSVSKLVDLLHKEK